MSDQQQIGDWNRTQAHYSQARHFTPGRQSTQYDRLDEKGAPRQMDLLVVLHNDATSAEAGKQRVDLIVDSGSYDRKAEHANGHLVNSYDEEAGLTDHTTLYSDKEMGLISAAAGRPALLQDRPEGGPPGAQIYSIRAQVRENENGQLVIDTDAPMGPGPGASRYSLHDVQEGMNRVAESASYGYQVAENEHPARDPLQRQGGSKAPVVEGVRFASRSAEAAGPIAPRGVSSQAGLAAARGESRQVRSLPSVPAPGRPGSRFNPFVRKRIQPPRPEVDPSKLIQVPTWSEPPAPSEAARGESSRKEQPREPIAEGQEIKVPAFGAQQAAQQGAAQAQEGDSVAHAASNGFVGGLVGGASAQLGVQSHPDRFPELKGTEPLNGVTARFPELAPDADDQQLDADQELGR